MAPPKRKLQDSSPKTPGKKTNLEAKYNLGDKILCRHDDDMKYEAKIIELSEKDGKLQYRIHFLGWNRRYDIDVNEADAHDLFTPHSDEAARSAVEERKTRKSASSTPKPELKVEESSEIKASTSSRKSTGSITSKTPNKPKAVKTPVSSKKKEATPARKSLEYSNRFSLTSSLANQPAIDILLPPTDHTAEQATLLTALGELLTSRLNDVLIDDNDRIMKHYKLPKVPADTSVEKIIQDFCETKGVRFSELEDCLPDVEKKNCIEPAGFGLEDAMMCVLNVFDTCFIHLLLYKYENPHFVSITRAHCGNEDVNYYKIRFSKRVGITYLLRFFCRMPLLYKRVNWELDPLRHLVNCVKQLCDFLSSRTGEYYHQDNYYRSPEQTYVAKALSSALLPKGLS